jgi:hypothetical protein
MDLVPRIGVFFFLIGGGSLILFILAAMGSRFEFLLLLIALFGLSLGFAFTRKKEPPKPSERFAYLRKMNEQSRKKREEREKNRKK